MAKEVSEYGHDYLIINDCSTDNTAKILDENHTNYIVIVPPRSTFPHLNNQDLWVMKSIFGEEKVHDFSGDPVLTSDERFYYDGDNRLQARGDCGEEALTVLYEGISRTREKLCLLVVGNEELLSQVMSIRKQ